VTTVANSTIIMDMADLPDYHKKKSKGPGQQASE